MSPPTATSFPATGPRHAGLDRARAVAVLAMVMGHTLDAVLSDAARGTAGVMTYWSLRAITAPLFLFVAGWAFSTTVARTGALGLPVLRRYLPRVALLLGWGYLLRWPGWGLSQFLSGDRTVWEHFLAFDALHGVAGALLVGSGVLALAKGLGARMAVLAGLTALFPLVSPWMRALVDEHRWPLVLEQALASRTSNFPLFPWSAYFFAGSFTGLGLSRLPAQRHWRYLMVGGLVFLGLVTLWGKNPDTWEAARVTWRMGMLLVVASLAMLAPARLDALLVPVGRASLWVYIVHLPMAYGWSTFSGLAGWLGHSLSVPRALGVGLCVLMASLAIALPAKKLYGRWKVRGRGGGGGSTPKVSEAEAVPLASVVPESPVSELS